MIGTGTMGIYPPIKKYRGARILIEGSGVGKLKLAYSINPNLRLRIEAVEGLG